MAPAGSRIPGRDQNQFSTLGLHLLDEQVAERLGRLGQGLGRPFRLAPAQRLIADQKLGGVQALITRAGSSPTQRKRCGRWLAKL